MRTSPFDKNFIHEQKRAAILSEAAALFNVHGARSTRLEDVARRLGINASSLYYYVRSKDELIYRTYLESCSVLEALLDEACAEGRNGAQRLAAFVRLHFATWQAVARGERPHFAILTEIPGLKPGHRAEIAERYKRMFARVQSVIEDGRRDGSLQVSGPREAALLVFGLVQMTVLWVDRLESSAYGQAAEAFIDVLFNGVAADRGGLPGAAETRRMADRIAADIDAPSARADAFCAVGCDSFNRKGFTGTSLDEIAERLQVSKGSFYHHVKDKDDLLRQCFLRSLDRIREAQAKAGKLEGNGLDTLWACAVELFTVQNGAAGPLIRFNLVPSLAPDHRQQFRDGLAEVSAEFGRRIREGEADGSLRPVSPLVAEQMLLTAIDLSNDLRRLRPVEDTGRAFLAFFGIYFRGLAAPAASAGAN